MFKTAFTFQRCGLSISDSGEVTEAQNFRPGSDFRAPGDGEGQGSLACCSPQGRRVRHDLETEQLPHCRQIPYHLSHQGSPILHNQRPIMNI